MKGGRNGTHLPAPQKVRTKKDQCSLRFTSLENSTCRTDLKFCLRLGRYPKGCLSAQSGSLSIIHDLVSGGPHGNQTWLAKKTPFAHVFYHKKWGSIASLAIADPNIIGSKWLAGRSLWSMFFFNIFSGALYLMVCPCRSTQSLHHKMTAKFIYGHRSKLWCSPVMELWAYHRDTSVRYNLP